MTQVIKINHIDDLSEEKECEFFDQLISLYYMCPTDGCLNYKEKMGDDFCSTCKKGIVEEFKQTNGRDYIPSVYFILGIGTEKVKIGYSSNVNKRIEDLQIGSPVKLLIIGSFPGTQNDECKLHNHLKKYNSHGEWFYMTDEVIDIIELANSKGLNGIKALLGY